MRAPAHDDIHEHPSKGMGKMTTRRRRGQPAAALAPLWRMGAAAALLAGTTPAAAQAPAARGDTLPPDTWATPGVRALVERARDARGRDVEGIRSYEGLLTERIHVGLTSPAFRRERTLFEQEDAARIRWSRDGERAIQWLAARRAVPIIGAVAPLAGEDVEEGSAAAELEEELHQELSGEASPLGFTFDPWDDRLVFGDSWALHPLSDSARARYRYHPGDTLTLRLPDGREVVLLEVRVEPREADFNLVAGSLWFDRESGALVRASYRPARPFDLELDEPEDASDVPGVLKPITAEIDYVTVEYSLHELRWWLPRRYALQGTARVGRLLTVPLLVEWSVREYEVNPETSSVPVTGPLPPGWTRSEKRVEREGRPVRYVTVIVPPRDSLRAAAGRLLEGAGERDPLAFDEDEIAEIRGTLAELVPGASPFRPRWSWGLQDGLVRYNRVEGLSAGARVETAVPGGLAVRATARLGVADLAPRGELALLGGPAEARLRVAAYRRLAGMGDMDDPHGLGQTLQNLAFGSDRAQYYDAWGAEVGRAAGGAVRSDVRLFVERHEAVGLESDFFLLEPLRDREAEPVLAAEEGWVGGASALLRWQAGADPTGLVASGSLRGEAAAGDLAYRRGSATVALTHPLPLGLAGAVEVGAGVTGGDLPVQKAFFLGGPATLRGFDTAELRGTAFWLGRAEVGTGFAGARLALFGDAAWAGPREDFGTEGWAASAGVGASLLDGLLRFDVARALRGGSGWEVHLYLDALF